MDKTNQQEDKRTVSFKLCKNKDKTKMTVLKIMNTRSYF